MLPKKLRLYKNASFRYLYHNGLFINGDCFNVFYKKSKASRFGFSISNKIGNSVVRNKLKRRLRDIVYRLFKEQKKNFQVIIVAKKGLEEKSFIFLYGNVKKIFKNIGLI